MVQIEKLEVGQHLSVVNGLNLLDALELDEQGAFDDEVSPVHAAEAHAFVHDGNCNVPDEGDSLDLELMSQAHGICGLEEPGANGPMDFDRASNHFLDERIPVHEHVSLQGKPRASSDYTRAVSRGSIDCRNSHLPSIA